MVISSNDSGAVPPLFSPEFQRDPYPTYHHCLAGPPLQPLEGRPGVWLLFGYEACTTTIRDTRLSSIRPAKSLVAVADDALPEFDDLVRHMQRWLLLRDDPRHAELRKLMNRGFTPAVVESLRHKVDAIIDALLDEMRNAGAADLIKDFAYPLPVRVICELLGEAEWRSCDASLLELRKTQGASQCGAAGGRNLAISCVIVMSFRIRRPRSASSCRRSRGGSSRRDSTSRRRSMFRRFASTTGSRKEPCFAGG
jgi:cytochrome P450